MVRFEPRPGLLVLSTIHQQLRRHGGTNTGPEFTLLVSATARRIRVVDVELEETRAYSVRVAGARSYSPED